MNIPHIRHAWFPPTIPKRKHSVERDAESEWPNAYRPLSPPSSLGLPRPAKRLKGLEGGLAGLTLDTHNILGGGGAQPQIQPSPSPSPPQPINNGQQIHDQNDASFSEAEPYITSIYEYASPYPTTTGSSVVSLPLRGEVSEASASDEEKDMIERDDARESVMAVDGHMGMPGYVVYEPELGAEKRKKDGAGVSRTGKQKWFEPEKDRIVILDLESSEDESVTRSPRRRRSAFSLSSGSTSEPSTGRPRSQTQTGGDSPEYIVNPALLSHLPPVGITGKPIIPREEDPGKAIVLFRPAPWGTGVAPLESPADKNEQGVEEDSMLEMDSSPLMVDEDAMDVDS